MNANCGKHGPIISPLFFIVVQFGRLHQGFGNR